MAWITALALAAAACGGDDDDDDPGGEPDAGQDDGGIDAGGVDAGADDDERERFCPTAESADRIPQRLAAAAMVPTMHIDNLVATVNSGCAQCHLAPNKTGGFTYVDSMEGREVRINGVLEQVPGLSETAPRMRDQLGAQRMPPAVIRQTDPEGFRLLGTRINAWLEAGAPDGVFDLPDEKVGVGQQLPPWMAAAMTDLGDCIPVAEKVGHDLAKDAFFADLAALPDNLNETDLFSLDAYQLAQKGTVAFNVEYPLWADNAHKGRWVHVPSTGSSESPVRTSIAFDAKTGRFQIPVNTRFYKTFFKSVKESDGQIRYRKIETRLIVVRPEGQTLFGTYLWDENETKATLHRTPYRSGEPFKDLVKTFETDVTTKTRRTYAVPGAHRCRECHSGSESESFILGFTPLQIGRRPMGEGGREAPTAKDELSQLDRLVAYGVVAGVTPETAPKLENTGRGGVPARNEFELRAQGYATGNCAHCHNPRGFAKQLGINFVLAPGGDIFQWPTSLASIYPNTGPIVAAGNPTSSHIYRRMINPTGLQGSVPLLHMPLHTPGVDCAGVEIMGKWVTSVPTNDTPENIAAALDAARKFETACVEPTDVAWLEEDFTEPAVYTPRRADWDTENGMPESVRNLEFTPGLSQLARTRIANGYWSRRPECQFPDVPEPEGGLRPWMLLPDGSPRRPFGEIFYQTPGAAYFTDVCQKCHGVRANGQSGIARTILIATGGRTRVANFMAGLFGNDRHNLELFDVPGPSGTRNVAGNYLIWMAMGGTQAFFPPGLEEIIGTNGPNMLNQVRSNCATLLPGHPQQLTEGFQRYEVYAAVCAFDNEVTEEVGFVSGTLTPRNPEAQKAWLDHAAQNAGWMIFTFLKEEAATGNWPHGKGDCEDVFPIPGSLDELEVSR